MAHSAPFATSYVPKESKVRARVCSLPREQREGESRARPRPVPRYWPAARARDSDARLGISRTAATGHTSLATGPVLTGSPSVRSPRQIPNPKSRTITGVLSRGSRTSGWTSSEAGTSPETFFFRLLFRAFRGAVTLGTAPRSFWPSWAPSPADSGSWDTADDLAGTSSCLSGFDGFGDVSSRLLPRRVGSKGAWSPNRSATSTGPHRVRW